MNVADEGEAIIPAISSIKMLIDRVEEPLAPVTLKVTTAMVPWLPIGIGVPLKAAPAILITLPI